jgi:hypothetical protein
VGEEKEQRVEFTFGGLRPRGLSAAVALRLNDWLVESAATARSLELKITEALESGETIELSQEERDVLLGTKLRYLAEETSDQLARLASMLKSAERSELELDLENPRD